MQGTLPIHIGVIPDGNRRWARKVGLPITEAYRIGSDKVEEFLDWSLDFGIKIVTVYVLSTENFLRRSKLELELLYRLLKEKLIKVRRMREFIGIGSGLGSLVELGSCLRMFVER